MVEIGDAKGGDINSRRFPAAFACRKSFLKTVEAFSNTF
jgi:hypothetical protein